MDDFSVEEDVRPGSEMSSLCIGARLDRGFIRSPLTLESIIMIISDRTWLVLFFHHELVGDSYGKTS